MVSNAKGTLEQKKFTFTWELEQFFTLSQDLGDYYRSSDFQIQCANIPTQWYLTAYPCGEREESKDYVSLFLWYDRNTEILSEIEVSVNVQCSMLDKANYVFKKKELTYKFYGSSNGPESLGWDKFVQQHIVLYDEDDDDGEATLVDNTLIILCEITILDITKTFRGYDQWRHKIDAIGLADYGRLIRDFTDVTFEVENRRIDARKAILSCRSPVFAAMFEHDTMENKENVVVVTDIHYDVMMEFLRFMHSGRVENIDDIVGDLLIAADKYQVIELKVLCEMTIYKELAVDNAIEILELTEMCDTIHLKRLVIEFIAAHQRDIVIKPDFKDVNKDVMYQIMLAIADYQY